jgi:hypothetical protein
MPKRRPVRPCKLCGETRELCYSHYFPRRLYAFARAAELKNPNPVMSINGQLKQVSDQYQDYLLCKGCEDRFSNLGEKWVLAILPVTYGGEFPLHKVVEPITPKCIAPRLKVYDLSRVEAFGIKQIVYFGLSIFWRSAVHHWRTPSGSEAPKVELVGYEEPIRRFLLSSEPLPNEIVLTVNLYPYKPVLPLVHPVIQERADGFSRYWFYIPGLHFLLFAGPQIPVDAKESDSMAGIVNVDLQSADSLRSFITTGIKRQLKGPKIQSMFKEIERVRGTRKSP